MGKFNILDIMNEKTREQINQGTAAGFREITLEYNDIVKTEHNSYTMDDLQELATGILMGGLQEPLVVGLVDGKYLLSSGHRRLAAIEILVKEGHEEFKMVPCRYKVQSMIEFRMAILIGNTFNRKMTDFDLMNQARQWKEVLTQAKKEKVIALERGDRIRDYVAEILKEPPEKIKQLQAIDNNAVDSVKEEFAKGNLKTTVAYAASRLPEDKQEDIAARAAAGQDVKCDEIRQQTEKKKKDKAEELKAADASDTDTTEEEKENARKLHAIKMLEKYYTYLNDEEVGILERMLEDCKRRKREYAIEEG
ncbi:MAG: ParB N-terminal domain-containing protein [Acetatifactor sp.]|nr:ParB N-terminal domain-containing protein [Acetatifactor sp.]